MSSRLRSLATCGALATVWAISPRAAYSKCSIGLRWEYIGLGIAHYQTLELPARELDQGKNQPKKPVKPISIVFKGKKKIGGKEYRTVKGYQGDKELGEKDIPIEDADDSYKKCESVSPDDLFYPGPDWFDSVAQIKARLKAQQTAAPASATAARTFDTDDLNGDGVGDIVKPSLQPPGVAVRLGNPDGSFQNPTVFPAGPGAEAVLLADFNADGQPDVALARQGDFVQDPGGLSILIGNRDATFSTAVDYPVGVAPRSLAVADFNGDGRLDVATANAGSLGQPGLPAATGSVSVLLGKGDGTLQPAVSLAGGGAPRAIAAADMNGDGNPDLAVANEDAGTVSVLLGKGDGSFQPAVNTAVGAHPTDLGATDLNGDGRLDIVLLHANATLSTWFGAGDGTLRAGGRYVGGVNIEAFAIFESPQNLRPFLLVPDQPTNDIHVVGVNLDGSLLTPTAYLLGPDPRSIALADFNNDGRLDAAVADQDNVSLLLGRGDGRLEQARPIVAGTVLRRASIAAGDFDGDGRSDLAAVGTNDGRISILRGAADATFQPAENLNPAPGADFVLASDLNADNHPDLVVVNNNRNQSSVSVFLGDGAGGFQSRQDYATGYGSRFAVAGDFNTDGRADVAVINGGDLSANPGGVNVLLTNADGSLSPKGDYDAAFSSVTGAAADFNGDGRLDLAVGGQLTGPPNFDFGLAILLGNGDGTFRALNNVLTDFGPTFLAAGDFNRDGVQDLILAHCCGDVAMTEMLGNGDGTFRLTPFPGGNDPVAVAAGDFDGNGSLDLAIVAGSSGFPPGYLTVLRNSLSPVVNIPATGNFGVPLAPDSIVSAFGARLATDTVAAPSPQWPAALGGTSVRVRDSAGVERDAGIAFASSGQVNYHMPADVAPGIGAVTITSGDGVKSSSPVAVDRISPGLFAANSGGLAAAWVIRVHAGGEQVLEPVVAVDAANEIVPAVIDLGPDTDRLILQLYGTGLRLRANLSDIHVSIGGVDAPLLYAGPQGEYPGLDQINVEIPRSLRGRGAVSVVVSVDGNEANDLVIRLL